VTARASVGGVTLNSNQTGPLPVPGLTATVTVTTASASLYVETDGDVMNGGSQVGDFVSVDVRVLVDGTLQSWRTVELERGTFATHGLWSFGFSLPVEPGQHTVLVETALRSASARNGLSTSATVGGSSRGMLTVLVLNK
jgi:hypothetical protein